MVEPIHLPDATADPDAYVAALLATAGDRDPVGVYARTPDEVRRLCTPLTGDAWSAQPIDGEWSAQQLVGHLFDVDLVYGFRWRLALTEDNPSYPGYDEKSWSELARPEPAALLTAFTALRRANLDLVRSLTPADWDRRAVHGEQGEEDVRRMMNKVAGHDIAHLNQLQRTIEAMS